MESLVTPDTNVSDIITHHPQTVAIFLDHGCPDMRGGFFAVMARVMPLRWAAMIHRIPLPVLINDLNAAINSSAEPGAIAPTERPSGGLPRRLAPTVDVEMLRAWLVERRPVLVLDIRTAADRAEWMIPGSVHVDAYAALKARNPRALAALDLPGDTPVVTVCGMGKVSLLAAWQLRMRGVEAYSLSGGMQAWSLAWNTADVSVPGSAARVIQVRRTGKGCLSYLIGADGEAAVIDAALDPAIYLDLAQQHGWRITSVLDTHIHADHLSRSRLLAEQSGATLYLPAQERVGFAFTPVDDDDLLSTGPARLRVLRTPGHTAESVSYLLDGRALLTGDTLFLNAVGRPDLHASPDAARTRAHLLYASLQRLLALPAETVIAPGHTSAPIPFDQQPLVATLADVRAQTPLLLATEEAFVESVLARIPPTPPNHTRIIELNEAGTLAENLIALEAGANRCAIA
jgi:glyoxylase-like metal-dependent hydrolase (beta-lactamase superfamily II)/rhodanese-related sulfurtransferase